MKTFSIKHLERFSEIKAHTLRIWEQRYSIFQPVRTKGKVRHYSLNDVQLLLDISLLIKNGAKISDFTTKRHFSYMSKSENIAERASQANEGR